ncbi:MAG TPA: hypothetical protein VJV75_05565, partial [Candidatus Polarisedimenticolia bacterium]|nr:hypothetical protein [Candidatus Polarisedimenticolia bacterium]
MAVLVLAAALDSGGGRAADDPAAKGLVEKTGVELFLLDIEAVDRSGQPMRGLTAADFVVRRNGRIWPIASVDDFCACPPA